jgi:hypothetical protein
MLAKFSIITGAGMKILIVFVFLAGLMFGITPVPRNNKSTGKTTTNTKVIANNNKTDDKKSDDKEKEKDRFKDADKNGVNDQREDDFQKIKEMKTKHKDILKQKSSKPKGKTTKPSKPKTVKKKTK